MSRIPLIFVCIALMACMVSAVPQSQTQGRISGADRLNQPEIAKCLQSINCAITFDFKPKCASDGRTYVNSRTIDCLNNCLKPNEQITIVSNWYCKDDAPQAVPISKL
ncbi:uncharacterized protein LOC123672772 [Harmonia axyridis]|uniref:uncharacterized protein LOC123672772 n=1 Tax=Harmonia axyridis TaxID=115357 RepID=UPI001E2780E1|nr:uncharacterized protein LOC123672772 [Harmonia axyridis]